jgi:predicted DNA-binding ribbon-helix-helix protein
VQALLVEEVIDAAWKMRRAADAQQRVVRHALLRYAGSARKRAMTPGALLADALGGDWRAEPFMNLEQYSERLQRSFFSALRRLDAPASRRRCKAVNPIGVMAESPRERGARHALRCSLRVSIRRRAAEPLALKYQQRTQFPLFFRTKTETRARAGTR